MSVVADSSQAYEQEANTLLTTSKLRRSLLRPQTAATIDHDLHVIDQAIAELKDAIAHDPKQSCAPSLARFVIPTEDRAVEARGPLRMI